MSDAGPTRRAGRWAHEAVGRRARQWPTLERLIASVERSPPLELHPVERAYDDFKTAARAARGLA
jgi:hypothetical protein